MSAGTVDILVKAREDAISTLQAVQAEIQKTGTVSEQTLSAYKDTRQEIMLSQRSLTTLTMAYREQYEAVYLAGRAFSDISAIIGRVLNMYEQYNVAMIRQNQLQKEVTAAQDKYNAALLKYGPASAQAVSALSQLTSAQNALGDAQQKNTAMLIGFAAQIPGFIGPVLNAGIALKVLAAYMGATGAAAAESAVGMGVQASAALADAAAIDVATASMTAFDIACAASIVSLAAFAGGIAIAGIYLQSQYQPALWQTTQTMNDLKTAFASRTIITADANLAEQRHKEALDLANKSLKDQLDWILTTADGDKRQAAAVKDLTDQYAAGAITAEQFAIQMHSLDILSDEIEKDLASTTVQVKTWQEQFVASAQEAATAFKDAFTGPMAQLGPEMSTAMANLVNITISAIDSGFIGQAQAGFQAFKDCVSGKMNDLPGMQQQTMDSIVAITTSAINSGLRGTAQEGIALFVQCVTSKQLSMVQEIDGYLKQLQASYDENNKTILRLTREGKTDEADIYRQANVAIKTAIDQLQRWREAAVSGKPINIPVTVTVDIEKAQADLDDFINLGSAAWQRSNKETGAGTITIPVTVDNAVALANIGAVQGALTTLTGSPTFLMITADNSQALATISEVQSALAALHDRTVTVWVNYQSLGAPPSYQAGGILPYTGLFFGHKGEEVVPASQVASPPSSSRASGPSMLNFQNKTTVQVDGKTVADLIEQRIIQQRRIASTYR